ncbi:MAG: hypothetical protein AAF573_08095 [Bacteroidota bacterium]
MRKQTHHFVGLKTILLFLISGLLFFTSCRKEDIPAPSEFTKEKREQLGDLIKVAIASDQSKFPQLSQTGLHDSTYWYVQKLYNQAINVLRNDGQSPSHDRWDKSRAWQVTILNIDDEKTAFVTPGGHLFISTGLLKSLEKEYELYYILTFEATLMHERFVLNRLINEYNTTTLENLIQGVPQSAGMPTLNDVAATIGELQFDENMTMEIDQRVVSLICKSSIFDRTGIISIMDNLEPNDTKWMQTRQSYDYRDQIDFIVNLPVDAGDDCGNFRSNGGYQKFVLDRL